LRKGWEMGDMDMGDRSQKSGVGSQKSGVGSRKSEVGSRKSGVGSKDMGDRRNEDGRESSNRTLKQ